MTLETEGKKDRIRRLNDEFRKSMSGNGKVVMTSTLNALPIDEKNIILREIQAFDEFDKANDPYEEHDFGTIYHRSERIFFKIDYYDPSYMFGSEDPSDEDQTNRVMSIMYAHEY